jgi:NAD(P)-dependent dehydrogenase (short-subunit alcohol dehydrogenase family)
MSALADKIALVTGASRGIGRATALELAARGARLIVHYGRSVDEARSVVNQIISAGGRADAVATDLASPEGAHALADWVRNRVGERIDIIVANAGIMKPATIEEMTVKEFDDLFAVNVRAPYFLVQQLLPILGEGSSVIFISSLAAHAAIGNRVSAYAATKGAIDTMVKHFASILGPRGIRANAVAPGVIDTEMPTMTKTEEGRATLLGMQALKRIAQPADVASVVAFLASDEARWITGETIYVDGGSRL